MYINVLFKDVIYLPCCQGHLKRFLKNIDFVENLEMTHIVRGREGRGGGGGTLCVQKVIYDSPLVEKSINE